MAMTLFEKKVEDFVESRLNPDNIEVRGKKIIHDALWGTQLLYPHEVAILNTPLIQRLRYIHQTSFTFLTYPSTLHTRFDHSLGVLHQANRLCGHIREKYSNMDGPKYIDDSVLWKIRLASLLHDCSHGPFSHTSEEVYGLYDDMQALVGSGKKFEGVSPSETLAYFILTSEPFKNFYDKVKIQYNVQCNIDDIIDLIHGRNKISDIGFQTDIVNGPFDADKLDYIFRDGHFSGLPMGIDIDRLWYSVEIHHIDPTKLQYKGSPMKRLVISSAGVNSLEQIVFSRMTLTSSVYHHHKVRACDCMFKGVIEFIRNKGLPICGRMLDSSADFLYLTDLEFFAEAERNQNKEVRELIGNIYNRRLLKRAFVISMKSIEPQSEDQDNPTNRIQNFIMLKKKPEGYKELRELAHDIWKKAGEPGRVEEVWVDIPDEPKLKDLQRTIVNSGTIDNPNFDTLNDYIPLDQWGKQYILNKWRGHVFCRAEYMEPIKKAAKEVLEERYDVNFNRYATLLAHL